ncbi:hypothetical protein M1N61_00395, partial [Peptococcaceae bacterium]|nr:hypothetical protein [Peptococcaceae bacterium]
MGRSVLQFLRGFVFVFFLAVMAYLIAAQADIDAMGIGYVAWALILGLLISNTIGTPLSGLCLLCKRSTISRQVWLY